MKKRIFLVLEKKHFRQFLETLEKYGGQIDCVYDWCYCQVAERL